MSETVGPIYSDRHCLCHHCIARSWHVSLSKTMAAIDELGQWLLLKPPYRDDERRDRAIAALTRELPVIRQIRSAQEPSL